MATPKFICGAECGIAVVGTLSAGTEHWSSTAGAAPTVLSSGHLFKSVRCFRFNAVGGSSTLVHTFTTAIASPGTQVSRFKFYFAGSLPSGSCHIYAGLGLSFLQYNAVDGTLSCGTALGTSQLAGPVIAADTVYEVETSITRDVAFGSRFKMTVNGTDYGSVDTGSGVSSGGTTVSIGVITGSITADLRVDDLIVSGTAADYPLGSGLVAGLYPNGDRTNSAASPTDGNKGHFYSATTDFGKGAGGAVATAAQNVESTSWQSLQNPLSTTIGSNFIADLLGASTEHLVWTHDPMPAAKTINGMMLVATTHSASTTANTISIGIIDFAGAGVIYMVSALDLSEATITVPVAIMSSGWTTALLNSAGFLFGDSTDVTPDPYLDGICMEVDYVPELGRYPHRDVRQSIPRGSVY